MYLYYERFKCNRTELEHNENKNWHTDSVFLCGHITFTRTKWKFIKIIKGFGNILH